MTSQRSRDISRALVNGTARPIWNSRIQRRRKRKKCAYMHQKAYWIRSSAKIETHIRLNSIWWNLAISSYCERQQYVYMCRRELFRMAAHTVVNFWKPRSTTNISCQFFFLPYTVYETILWFRIVSECYLRPPTSAVHRHTYRFSQHVINCRSWTLLILTS